MENRTQNEIKKLSFRITNSIDNHAKPRKYDWIVLIVSCISIVCSFIAILVAINVPKQIAEQQNKIALFEKRYTVYYELKSINDFLDGYYATCESAINILPLENLNELSPEQRKAIYYKSLWEGEIQKNLYSNNDDIGNILKQQSQIIESLGLVYHDITSDEEAYCKDFLNTYAAMTQRFVQVENADSYVAFGDFDKSYEKFDLSNILKKMEQQLRL